MMLQRTWIILALSIGAAWALLASSVPTPEGSMCQAHICSLPDAPAS